MRFISVLEMRTQKFATAAMYWAAGVRMICARIVPTKAATTSQKIIAGRRRAVVSLRTVWSTMKAVVGSMNSAKATVPTPFTSPESPLAVVRASEVDVRWHSMPPRRRPNRRRRATAFAISSLRGTAASGKSASRRRGGWKNARSKSRATRGSNSRQQRARDRVQPLERGDTADEHRQKHRQQERAEQHARSCSPRRSGASAGRRAPGHRAARALQVILRRARSPGGRRARRAMGTMNRAASRLAVTSRLKSEIAVAMRAGGDAGVARGVSADLDRLRHDGQADAR